MNRPKAISFDLDGTLYSMRKVALRMLFSMPGSLRFLAAYQQQRQEIRNQVFESGEDLHRAEYQGLAHSLGISLEEAEHRFHDVHDIKFVRTIGQIGPRRAALPLLRTLLDLKVPIAILSDLPVDRKLKVLGLDDLDFTVTLDSAETGALKPHPRAFKRIAEALNVPLAELVHVGDRLDTDVNGAIQAGARAVWLCRQPRGREPRGTLVINKLEDLYQHWNLPVLPKSTSATEE